MIIATNGRLRLSKLTICDLLIVLLLIGVVLTNYIWLKLDGYPIEGHDLLGVIPAVQVYRELLGMENTNKLYDRILGSYNPRLNYPPLSFLVLVLFYFVFGLQGQMVAMVNSPYIIVTLVSVYLIGKNIFNRPTGLLAAFILSSFPGFIAFSRLYWIEFGLMAYVSLDLYLLLKTNLFEKRKHSILLGITLALSFLHKAEFIPFVIGSFLLVILKSGILKDIFQRRWSNRLTNSTLTIALALGLSSFWWVRYGMNTFGRMFSVFSTSEDINRIKDIFSYKSLTFYLESISFLIGILFLMFFFLSLLFMIIKATTKKEKIFYLLFLIVSFIVPYVIFTLFITKTVPHILSLLPSLALIISAGLYLLRNRIFKIMITALIILYCFNIYLHSFYHLKMFDHFNYISAGLKRPAINYWLETCNLPRPEKLESAIKNTLEFIKADSLGKREMKVLSVFKNSAFKNCIYGYYSLIGNYQTRFFTYYYKFISNLAECDYIIIEQTEGESLTQIFSRNYDIMDEERENFKKMFKDGVKGFELIKIYKIPNGDTSAFIYKRRAKTTQIY